MYLLKNHVPLIASVILGLVVIFFIIFVRPSPAPAAPTITWALSEVVETVAQGGEETMVVSFTSREDLTNVAVKIVPELEPYVSANPPTFDFIESGVTVTILLTFSTTADAPSGTLEGTLHLKDNTGKSKKTYAKPLPITVNIWQSVAEKGLALNHPPDWQLNPSPLELGGPISLDTFANVYQQGGIIPAGGAVINITTTPLPTASLSDVIAKDLQGATIESTEETSITGEAATRVFYTASFIPALTYKSVAVYVPHNELLYKFFLSYHAGDPLENQFLANFQQILDTVQFMQ